MASRPSEKEQHRTVSTLADLSLQDLRDHRRALSAEEDQVSYWRRSVQARLDVLRAASGSDAPLSMEDLAKALGTTGTGARRQQLLSVAAAEDLPDLPGFGELWAAVVDPDDEAAVASACEALEVAEKQLTAYRKALHQRIDAATEELILRYRDNPDLSLDLLPGGASTASV